MSRTKNRSAPSSGPVLQALAIQQRNPSVPGKRPKPARKTVRFAAKPADTNWSTEWARIPTHLVLKPPGARYFASSGTDSPPRPIQTPPNRQSARQAAFVAEFRPQDDQDCGRRMYCMPIDWNFADSFSRDKPSTSSSSSDVKTTVGKADLVESSERGRWSRFRLEILESYNRRIAELTKGPPLPVLKSWEEVASRIAPIQWQREESCCRSTQSLTAIRRSEAGTRSSFTALHPEKDYSSPVPEPENRSRNDTRTSGRLDIRDTKDFKNRHAAALTMVSFSRTASAPSVRRTVYSTTTPRSKSTPDVSQSSGLLERVAERSRDPVATSKQGEPEKKQRIASRLKSGKV